MTDLQFYPMLLGKHDESISLFNRFSDWFFYKYMNACGKAIFCDIIMLLGTCSDAYSINLSKEFTIIIDSSNTKLFCDRITGVFINITDGNKLRVKQRFIFLRMKPTQVSNPDY